MKKFLDIEIDNNHSQIITKFVLYLKNVQKLTYNNDPFL